MNRRHFATATGLLLAAAIAPTTLAGTFKTITIDDDYSDWEGVPIAATDPVDNAPGVDIASVQVANDNDFLYVRASYHTAKSVQTSIALDNDNDPSTGFDIFGLGLVGSEAGWQNDFPFDQRGGFNIGTLIDGAAMLSSFEDRMDREWALPLNATFDPNVGPGEVFPNDSFTLLLWSDTGDMPFNGFEATEAIPYTLAVVPEPTTALLVLFGSLMGAGRRR